MGHFRSIVHFSRQTAQALEVYQTPKPQQNSLYQYYWICLQSNPKHNDDQGAEGMKEVDIEGREEGKM